MPRPAKTYEPVMSRGTWLCLLDLANSDNMSNGLICLKERAGLSEESAEIALREFNKDFCKLEEYFKNMPREDGTCGGGSPPAADAAESLIKPSTKFFVSIDSWGQVLSLHSTQKAAIKRGKTYDGFSVIELELDGKDQCIEGDTDDEDESVEPAAKRGKSSEV